jgi:hypothetical protein
LRVGDFVDTPTFEVKLSALALRVGDSEVGPSNSNVMLDVYLFFGEPEMSAGRRHNKWLNDLLNCGFGCMNF